MKKLTAFLTIAIMLCLAGIDALSQSTPSTQASAVTISNVGTTAARIGMTRGNGMRRIVVIAATNQASDITSPPCSTVTTTAYTADPDLAGTPCTACTTGTAGSVVSYVVMNSTARSVDVQGLAPGTEYFVKVFEYNYSGSNYNYSCATATNNPRSFWTKPAPPTAIAADMIADQSFNCNWVNPTMAGDYTTELQVSTDASFTSGVTTYTIDDQSESLNAESLNQHTTYYYRLRTYSNNQYSDWGNVVSATTQHSPSFSGLTDGGITFCTNNVFPVGNYTCSDGTCYFQIQENGQSFSYPADAYLFSQNGDYYLRSNYGTEGSPLWSDAEPMVSVTLNLPPSPLESGEISYDITPLFEVCRDESLTIHGYMDGTEPITYEWYKGTTPISSSSTIGFSSFTTDDSGDYTLIATNMCGGYTSNFSIDVGVPPTILSHSALAQTLCDGGDNPFLNTTLQITNDGTEPVHYEWYFNGIPTYTDQPSYEIPSVTTDNAGEYKVVVSNRCGTSSESFEITVHSPITDFSINEVASSVCWGSDITFSGFDIIGTYPTNWEGQVKWFVDDNTNPESVTTLDWSWGQTNQGAWNNISPGNHEISLQIENECNYGQPIAKSWFFYVYDNPTMAQALVNREASAPSISEIVCLHSAVTFSIGDLDGDGLNYTYQWYHGENAIAGATDRDYADQDCDGSDEGVYKVAISNGCTTITSYTASLTVNMPVTTATISGDFVNSRVCDGTDVSFSLQDVNGSDITQYVEWFVNGQGNGKVNIQDLNFTVHGKGSLYEVYAVVSNDCNNEGTYQTQPVTVYVFDNPTLEAFIDDNVNTPTNSATVCSGSWVEFYADYVLDTDSENASFQWYHSNGDAVAGATDFYLTYDAVAEANEGAYYVVITDDCGSTATSNEINLDVRVKPVISSEVESQSVCIGQPFEFCVGVDESDALGTTTYQWYQSSPMFGLTMGFGNPTYTPLADATTSCYGATASSADDDTEFFVVVTNDCGSTTSYHGLLNVHYPPTYVDGSAYMDDGVRHLTAPNYGSMYITCQGSNVTFHANFDNTDGAEPVTYSWRFSSTEFFGGWQDLSETSNELQLINVNDSDHEGYYEVTASNSCGSTSFQWELDIEAKPSSPEYYGINQFEGSSSETFCAGTPVNLVVSSYWFGDGADIDEWYPTFQWYFNGTPIQDATDSNYGFNISTETAGQYSLIASNDCGSGTQSFTIYDLEPVTDFTLDGNTGYVCPTDELTYSVSGEDGSGPWTYQWSIDGFSVNDATNSSFDFIVNTMTPGEHFVGVRVYNQCNLDGVYNELSITVRQAPYGASVTPTGTTTVCDGSSVELNVSSYGDYSGFEWFHNGDYVGTGSSINANIEGNYFAVAIGYCDDNATSNEIFIDVKVQPSLNTISGETVVCEQGTAHFCAELGDADFASPISYQWYRNEIPMEGSTLSCIDVPAIAENDGYSYSVVASNTCGTATTNPVTLDVKYFPVISSGAVNTTTCEGQPFQFCVNIDDLDYSGTTTYQWYYVPSQFLTNISEFPISGATESCYSGTGSVANDGNAYFCVVSNDCGSATSNHGTLDVHFAPVLNGVSFTDSHGTITEPNGFGMYITCQSSNVTFNMDASTDADNPLTYEWSFSPTGGNGSQWGPEVGTNSFELNNVDDETHEGYYTVTASNLCGTTSYTWELDIEAAPNYIGYYGINDNIFSNTATVCNGSNVTMHADYWYGDADIDEWYPTYQWFFNGNPISDATNYYYQISVSTETAGNYTIVATNNCGTGTQSFTIYDLEPVTSITLSGTEGSVCTGTQITYSVGVNAGSPEYSYQWFVGADAQAETGSTFSTTANWDGNSLPVTVRVWNGCNNETNILYAEEYKDVYVWAAPSNVAVTPSGTTTVCSGYNVTLSVSSDGDNTGYDWYFDNSFQASGSTFVASQEGSYYAVALGNCNDNATSNEVTVDVKYQPSVSSISGNNTVCDGSTTTFCAELGGGDYGTPITYQWYSDNIGALTNIGYAPISGATSSCLEVTGHASGINHNNGVSYHVVATNACGSSTSSSVTLHVNTTPSFASSINDITVCVGSNATFTSSGATGTPTPTYQWYNTNGAISDATSTTLVVENPSEGGQYSLVATNSCGSATASASLYINAPSVSISSTSTSVCVGSPFTMTATSETATSYQWYKGGSSLGGKTTSELIVASVGTGDAGTYECVVLSNGCSATSNQITIDVPASLQITSSSIGGTHQQGSNVTFTVSTSGGGSLSYQWSKSGHGAISGATNDSYAISGVTCSDVATYSVVVTSTSCGTTAGANGYLNVTTPAPSTSTAMGIAFSNWTRNSMVVSVTNYNPSNYRLVVGFEGCNGTGTNCTNIATATVISRVSAAYSGPTAGVVYTGSSTWGNGTSLGNLNVWTSPENPTSPNTAGYAIVSGPANSVNVTGLARNRMYVFYAYEYQNNTGSTCTPSYAPNPGIVNARKTSNKESIEEEIFSVQTAENFAMTDIRPNPATTDINFSIMNEEQLPFAIEIYSVEGMKVYNDNRNLPAGTNAISINLKSDTGVLPSGMYILRVRSGNDEISRRFMYLP